MRKIVLIAHNLRSCHNVGSLLRTAEGLGVTKVYLTGYTPYPLQHNDTRLPHLAAKIDKQIHKTALDAERLVAWEYAAELEPVLAALKTEGFVLAAIEQANHAVCLPDYRPPEKLALLVGREVEGVESEVLAQMDVVLEIPMFGRKESFNVVQAAAMGLYHAIFRP
ncbi:MAG TPA: TrmH family RNA methyltransferase [Candidatus Saccharimonadales bacterium]|nr:TrmH family RNA methyltransferase [Candidatus Saccharimonadales bacterium]